MDNNEILVNTILDTKNQEIKDLKEKIQKLIVDEILIAHSENQPTSRLTSLSNKIKDLAN